MIRLLTRRHIALLLVAVVSCGMVAVYALGGRVRDAYADRVYGAVSNVPSSDVPRVGIVFGAGVWRGGAPSPVLYDRLETAAELYQAKLVSKLLLTGDNRVANYNEPAVMRHTLERMGVPPDALVEDFAGRRTYDSCYRAHEIFGVKDAVLITQEFHLARAVHVQQAWRREHRRARRPAGLRRSLARVVACARAVGACVVVARR